MAIDIDAKDVDASISIVSGKQKKDPSKSWYAVKVVVGEWSTLIFPKTSFETNYLKKCLGEE